MSKPCLQSMAIGVGTVLYTREGVPVGFVNRFYALKDVPNTRDRPVTASVYMSSGGALAGDATIELCHAANVKHLRTLCNKERRLLPLHASMHSESACCLSTNRVVERFRPDDWVPTETQLARMFSEFMDARQRVEHHTKIALDARVGDCVRRVLRLIPFANTSSLAAVESQMPSLSFDDFDLSMFDGDESSDAWADDASPVLPETPPAEVLQSSRSGEPPPVDLDVLMNEMEADSNSAEWRAVVDSIKLAHVAGSQRAVVPCDAGASCQNKRNPEANTAYDCFEGHRVCLDCLITAVRVHTAALKTVLRGGNHKMCRTVPALWCPIDGCRQQLSPMFVYTVLGQVAPKNRAAYAEADEFFKARQDFLRSLKEVRHSPPQPR